MDNTSQLRALQAQAQASTKYTEPWEFDKSDEEILAETKTPTPFDAPYDPTISPVQIVEEAAPGELPQVPRCYGPIRIVKVLDTKLNVHQRKQAMAQADLEEGGQKTRLLVTAFGDRISLVEGLKTGATYQLRGILEKRVRTLNGDKIPSLYLNLI